MLSGGIGVRPEDTVPKDLCDIYTLPETNIAPENGWLEYYFPFGMIYFQGLRFYSSGIHGRIGEL